MEDWKLEFLDEQAMHDEIIALRESNVRLAAEARKFRELAATATNERDDLRREVDLLRNRVVEREKAIAIAEAALRNSTQVAAADGDPDSDRLIDRADGTVIDSVTGLMWMRPLLGQSIDDAGNVVGESQEMTFDDAAKAAASTDFAGHKDWRVPTIDELQEIIGKRSKVQPTIIQRAFGMPNKTLWSSTQHPAFSKCLLTIFSCGGDVQFLARHGKEYVRLVRNVA